MLPGHRQRHHRRLLDHARLRLRQRPNNQGGGIYIDSCNPIIFNCTFQDNYSDLVGGAICGRFAGGSISDCAFVANTASDSGGAICMFSSNINIMSCQFTGNNCEKPTTTCGGAIYNEDSSPTISNSVFSGNGANQGAGIYNNDSDAFIVDCEFAGCALGSDRGGGIYNYQSATTIKTCLFRSNEVDVSGGAIYEGESCSSSIVNCILRNNKATALGGAFYTDTGTTTAVTNCTIYANNAGSRGGGVYNYYGKPVFTNCIIWDNTAAMGGAGVCNESDTAGVATLVRYSDIQGTALYQGAGNIIADPQFVYPANDDLHLTAGSPCIDAGTNSISNIEIEDYDKNPRVVDGNLDGMAVVDMGAYEHQMGLRISDHLMSVHISQGQLYESPDATSPGYLFVAEMQTDNSVDHIDFLSAAGYAYRITNVPHTSSNGVDTFHETSGKREHVAVLGPVQRRVGPEPLRRRRLPRRALLQGRLDAADESLLYAAGHAECRPVADAEAACRCPRATGRRQLARDLPVGRLHRQDRDEYLRDHHRSEDRR